MSMGVCGLTPSPPPPLQAIGPLVCGACNGGGRGGAGRGGEAVGGCHRALRGFSLERIHIAAARLVSRAAAIRLSQFNGAVWGLQPALQGSGHPALLPPSPPSHAPCGNKNRKRPTPLAQGAWAGGSSDCTRPMNFRPTSQKNSPDRSPNANVQYSSDRDRLTRPAGSPHRVQLTIGSGSQDCGYSVKAVRMRGACERAVMPHPPWGAVSEDRVLLPRPAQ
jgi:hypothetical protein